MKFVTNSTRFNHLSFKKKKRKHWLLICYCKKDNKWKMYAESQIFIRFT